VSLVRLILSGSVYDANTGGNKVEEWSIGISLLGGVGPDVAGALPANVTSCTDWFSDPYAWIDATVALERITLNEVDVATGIQINDPTVEEEITPGLRGGVTGGDSHPLGTSYRVSLDTGTRNRSHKGGFFAPRCAGSVQMSGRWDGGQVAQMLGAADSFIDSLNTNNGGQFDVGVWSRKLNSVTKSTRLRIGDVPDNISRRRRQLDETYQVLVITT